MSKNTISYRKIKLIFAFVGTVAAMTTIIVNGHAIKKTFFEPNGSVQPSPTSSETSQKSEIPQAQNSPSANFSTSNTAGYSNRVDVNVIEHLPSPIPKPIPEQTITDYYSYINSGKYINAWNKLSSNFQKNSSKNSYSDFRNWWKNQVKGAVIQKITPQETLSETATVDVRFKYISDDEKASPRTFRFFLVWEEKTSSWLIDQTKNISDLQTTIIPNSKPSPNIPISPERVNFTSSDTEIPLDGNVSPNKKKRYLIRLTRGQKLAVKLLQVQGNVSFAIIDPAGQMKARITNIGGQVEHTVSRDGDYAIEISSPTNSYYVVSFEVRSQNTKPLVTPSIVPPKIQAQSGETRSGLPPISQPSPSPTVTSQASPEQAVRDYWSKISDGNCQTAWNQQSAKFKQNKTLHPNGYASFRREFCQEIDWVRTDKVTTVELDDQQNKAIVDVDFTYHKKTGRIVNMSLRLTLVRDDKAANWLIDESKYK